MKPHIEAAKTVWKEHLDETSVVVDATLGNGQDTLFLASLVPRGHVYAYEIQAHALEAMKEKIKGFPITLIHKSHSDLCDLPSGIDLFVYNFGYLPGGDKTITTKTDSSLESVQKALSLLSAKGLICLTCYPGHVEGKKEAEALLQFAKSLSKKNYLVELREWVNRLNSPFLLLIKPQI